MECKKLTDTWFPLIFTDSTDFYSPKLGLATGDIQVNFTYGGDTNLSGYYPSAAQFKESGSGVYWLQMGASEFLDEGNYQVSVYGTGIINYNFPVECRDHTFSELYDFVSTISGLINTINTNVTGPVATATNLTTLDNTVNTVSGNITALNDISTSDVDTTITSNTTVSNIETLATSNQTAIQTVSGHLNTVSGYVDGMEADLSGYIASIAVSSSDIADAVWDEPVSGHDAANTGTGLYGHIERHLYTVSGNLNSLDVTSSVTSALNSYDPPTRTELTTDINSVLSDLRIVSGNLNTVSGNIDTVDSVVDTINTNIGTPVALDGGAATVGGMLTKMADDNDGGTFDATTDSLAELNTAIIAGVPLATTISSGIAPTGTVVTGTWANTDLDNGVYWHINPTAQGLNVWVSGCFGANRKLDSLKINGYFDATAARYVNINAFNWNNSTYEQITDEDTRMNGNASSDIDYRVTLLQRYANVNGCYMFEFTSNSTNTNDDLYLDQIIVDSISEGGVSASEIANAVWDYDVTAHENHNGAGYRQKEGPCLVHGIISGVTSQTEFTGYDAPNTTDLYKWNRVRLHDHSGGVSCIRTIFTHDGTGNITLTSNPSFTIEEGMHYFILSDRATVDRISPKALTQIVDSGNAQDWDQYSNATLANQTNLINYLTTVSGNIDNIDTELNQVTVSGLTPAALSEIVASGDAANWTGDATAVLAGIQILSGQINTVSGNITGLNDITVADILAGTVDSKTVEDIYKILLAYAYGDITRSGNDYVYKDQSDNTLFTHNVVTGGRTQS